MGSIQSINTGNQESNIHIMICHGFGATNRDLVDLASVLDPNGQFGWHFPQGPLQIPNFNGYAWFPRHTESLTSALQGAYFNKLADLQETGLTASASELGNWIRQHDLQEKNWIFGGFSQGSMVALQTALQEKMNILALIILSGTLIDRQETTRLLRQTAPFPVFQSHGRQDPVLPLPGAMALRELLEEFGFKPDWQEFNGGHEIPPQIIDSLHQFLGLINAGHQP